MLSRKKRNWKCFDQGKNTFVPRIFIFNQKKRDFAGYILDGKCNLRQIKLNCLTNSVLIWMSWKGWNQATKDICFHFILFSLIALEENNFWRIHWLLLLFSSPWTKLSKRKYFTSVVGVLFFPWNCPWRAVLCAEPLVPWIMHMCGLHCG